jgi:hypothetical protein
MPDLPAEAEEAITRMSAGEFAALTAKLRAPDAAEQIRTHAAKVLSGSQLDAFVSAANPAAFTNESGAVDGEKVIGHLTAIHLAGHPPATRPGDNARAEIKKRFGVEHPRPAPIERPGDAGRAAVAKRHGTKATRQ